MKNIAFEKSDNIEIETLSLYQPGFNLHGWVPFQSSQSARRELDTLSSSSPLSSSSIYPHYCHQHVGKGAKKKSFHWVFRPNHSISPVCFSSSSRQYQKLLPQIASLPKSVLTPPAHQFTCLSSDYLSRPKKPPIHPNEVLLKEINCVLQFISSLFVFVSWPVENEMMKQTWDGEDGEAATCSIFLTSQHSHQSPPAPDSTLFCTDHVNWKIFAESHRNRFCHVMSHDFYVFGM